MTPCNAAGISEEDGGANIDNAPEGAASIAGAKADEPFLIALEISSVLSTKPSKVM